MNIERITETIYDYPVHGHISESINQVENRLWVGIERHYDNPKLISSNRVDICKVWGALCEIVFTHDGEHEYKINHETISKIYKDDVTPEEWENMGWGSNIEIDKYRKEKAK